MSDTPTPGQQQLDAALAALNADFEDLRTAINARAAEIGDDIRSKVDAVSGRIDDVRAAWGHDEEESPAT